MSADTNEELKLPELCDDCDEYSPRCDGDDEFCAQLERRDLTTRLREAEADRDWLADRAARGACPAFEVGAYDPGPDPEFTGGNVCKHLKGPDGKETCGWPEPKPECVQRVLQAAREARSHE